MGFAGMKWKCERGARWVPRLAGGVAAWVVMAVNCQAEEVANLSEFAVAVVAAGHLERGSVGGHPVTGVVYRKEGTCSMVGAWFDSHTRAIRNYTVCGTRALSEGAVAHIPRNADVERKVGIALKGAVMRGEGAATFEEFSIKATRVRTEDGMSACMTELVVTAWGLLSFYGVQNSCQ